MFRLSTLTLVLALTGCSTMQSAAVDVSAESAALADRFQKELQGQLQAALKAGGPVGAIAVCQQAAPAIAAHLSAESGALVRRIALKERNPTAGVTGDMRARLNALARAPLTDDGKPASVQWTSGTGALARVHYLRAIPMQAQPCAACHGTSIAPDVQAAIDALYPNDRATGFTPGELRGAVAISWPAGQR